MITITGGRRKAAWRTVAIAAAASALVGVSTVTAVSATDHHTTAGQTQFVDRVAPADGTIALSPDELASWEAMTRTPEQRAALVDDLRSAFAGVADVSVPTRSAPATTSVVSTGRYVVEPAVAYGVSGDHFWITASYADMVNGAIWVAVRACSTRVPGWLCSTVGNVLSSWASGWGSGNSHGVWAAVYWSPPHYTGGRW